MEIRPIGRPTREPGVVAREAWVNHRQDKPSATANRVGYRVDRFAHVLNVHHRHLAYSAVEGNAAPPRVQLGDVGSVVGDPELIREFSCARHRDEISGEIHADDPCAESGKTTRCATVPTSHVEHSRTTQRGRKQTSDTVHDDSVAIADPCRVPAGDLVVTWLGAPDMDALCRVGVAAAAELAPWRCCGPNGQRHHVDAHKPRPRTPADVGACGSPAALRASAIDA